MFGATATSSVDVNRRRHHCLRPWTASFLPSLHSTPVACARSGWRADSCTRAVALGPRIPSNPCFDRPSRTGFSGTLGAQNPRARRSRWRRPHARRRARRSAQHQPPPVTHRYGEVVSYDHVDARDPGPASVAPAQDLWPPSLVVCSIITSHAAAAGTRSIPRPTASPTVILARTHPVVEVAARGDLPQPAPITHLTSPWPPRIIANYCAVV